MMLYLKFWSILLTLQHAFWYNQSMQRIHQYTFLSKIKCNNHYQNKINLDLFFTTYYSFLWWDLNRLRRTVKYGFSGHKKKAQNTHNSSCVSVWNQFWVSTVTFPTRHMIICFYRVVLYCSVALAVLQPQYILLTNSSLYHTISFFFAVYIWLKVYLFHHYDPLFSLLSYTLFLFFSFLCVCCPTIGFVYEIYM